jgi:N-methylhydantoinase A/oxoprolinase/acetone carboxylase beta subunit
MPIAYHAGIDTGGTYTDAAIIDAKDKRVLASAKALTTKGNLAVGIAGALKAALRQAEFQVSPTEINVLSISTTLATNAIVEGHGSRTATILCGFDDQMVRRTGIAVAFPDSPVIRLAGGHDHNGDEIAALDRREAENAIRDIAPGVSAFAIASAFAVRNASHELAIRDIVQRVSGKPATLSSELTADLDAPRRAMTATLNARLIGRITSLVESVQIAMTESGISCPLMIVKGDGSLARAEDVRLRPIETVLSGPAASVIGAKWLSGLDEFILSDVGGTTTDVAVLEHGMPRVAAAGAKVGGWQTMVRAIDVTTTGLGGDSEVHIGVDGRISLGPQRVVPLALLAQLYPSVLDVMENEVREAEGGSLLGRFALLPFAAVGSTAAGLNDREEELLARVHASPIALRKLAPTTMAQRTLTALVRKGLVQMSAFTPSDASHVLKLQANWSYEGGELGARIAARNRDRRAATDESLLALCEDVWDEMVSRSARCILDAALPAGFASEQTMRAVCRGQHQQGLVRLEASPRVPVIAVGGPAAVYYPEVGKRLKCRVVEFPEASVANAVGAASGVVAHRAEIRIEGDGAGTFRLFDGVSSRVMQSGAAALTEGCARAREKVAKVAQSFGVVAPDIHVRIEKSMLPDAVSDDGLLTALIVAEAATLPARP